MNDNYERFPNNIFKPTTIEDDYAYFLARFSNLYDLYEYLKSDPWLNRSIFRNLASIDGEEDFAGKPYSEAVEDLIKDEYNPGYTEFVRLNNGLENCINVPVHKYKTVMTLAGGHLNIPAYSVGSPLCYETEERIVKPKFVSINAVLNYSWMTTKNQVFNRAVIMTNVLKALENAGYGIDLNVFSLLRHSDEYMHIVIKIKNYGEKLNMISLYKTLCNIEFLRRIIFRIMETIEVESNWSYGYGSVCYEDEVVSVLKLNKNDIFFGPPDSLGIHGKDLGDDFARAIEYLKLDDKIDVDKAKSEFKNKVRKLTI